MKGAHNRRRWSNAYIVMAIVCCVFGCGILGLMGIHRLKERRSFNLMIKEKDDQILSLHLLLQKERSETRRKAEETEMKVASLGSQKAELGSKVSEMESTIASLREEQRAVESAFKEKENEMREKCDRSARVEALEEELRRKQGDIEDLSPQVEALKEELRRKEGKIEELNVRLRMRRGDIGSNATMAETEVTKSGGEANADRVKDDEARRGKEDENVKGVDDRGSEVRGSPRRFRGKSGWRAKGRRWRSVDKQTEARRSEGDSTMAENALRNSSAEQTHDSVEEVAESSETKMEGGHSTMAYKALGNLSVERSHASLEEVAGSLVTKSEGGRERENEQPGDETTEDRNEHERIDVLGRKGAAEKSEEERDVRDADENEDKEETEETEF